MKPQKQIQAALALAALVLSLSFTTPAQADLFTYTGAMGTNHSSHTATLLPNGKVLVAGGYGASSLYSLPVAELYAPATGLWTPAAVMNKARVDHTATLLPDGGIVVAGGYQGPYLSSAELYPAPFYILVQPRSQLGYWGRSVSFSIIVTNGTPPFSYQWRKDGMAISGATNSLLLLANLQDTDAGAYTVVATDAGTDSLTSQPANLTVNPFGVSLALYAGLTIEGVVGYTYGIQTTTDLSNTNSWAGVTNITLTAPTQLWYDPQPAYNPTRYYRVVPGPISTP
jgi:hypothetical protein